MANTKLRFLTGFFLLCVSSKLMAQDSTSIFRFSIEDLMNLSVEISTGMKSSTTSDEAPAAVFVITREDMDHMGFTTLGEALNFVPGFTVGKSIQSGQQKNIYVRGATQSEGILFLYNGQRLNDGISGGAVAFNPDYMLDNMKQIEVVRGPVSSLYGANAFVAVVNLIPFRPNEVKQSTFSALVGLRGNLYLHGSQKLYLFPDASAIVYASVYGLNDAISQRNVHQEVLDTTSGNFVPRNFSGQRNIEKTLVYNFGTTLTYKKIEIEGYYNHSQSSNHWGSGTTFKRETNPNEHIATNFRIGSRYENDFLKKHHFTALASFASHEAENVYKLENFRTVLYPGFDPPGRVSIFESDLGTSTVNIESFAELNFRKGHQTVVGFNLQKDFIYTIDNSTGILDKDGDRIFDTVTLDDTLDTVFKKESRGVYAAFLQHTWSPWKVLNFTGGLRFDRYSDFGNSINPRVTAVYRPSDQWTLKGMYGTAFRAPTFIETNQSDFSVIGGKRLIQNPNLKPETIQTIEFQVTSKPFPNLLLSLNVFHNDVQKVIRQVDIPGVPTQSKWKNAGSRDWEGVEAGIRYSPKNWISISGNYSYTDSEDEKIADKEDPVFGIPRHALNFAVNLNQDKFNLNVNGNSRFGWNDVPALETPNVRFERIDLIPYTILNARFMAKNIWQTLTINLDVRNVLNQKYYFTDDRIFVPQGIAGNSRQIRLGAQYTF